MRFDFLDALERGRFAQIAMRFQVHFDLIDALLHLRRRRWEVEIAIVSGVYWGLSQIGLLDCARLFLVLDAFVNSDKYEASDEHHEEENSHENDYENTVGHGAKEQTVRIATHVKTRVELSIVYERKVVRVGHVSDRVDHFDGQLVHVIVQIEREVHRRVQRRRSRVGN